MVWWLLGFAIAAEVFATSSMRAATEADPSWPWWSAAAAGYVVALGLFALALSRGAPLAISYAIWAGVGVALTALIAVAIRASDTAKGDLPAYLLTPIPTPMGDMSAVMVTSWQSDALLGAAITGGLLGYGFTLPGRSGAAFAVILAGYFLTQFYRRFARL